MGFIFNKKAFEKNYLQDEKDKSGTIVTKFQHNTNKRFKLLPFITNDGKIKGGQKNVRKDLITFKGIAGECYRLIRCIDKLSSNDLEKEKIIQKIIEKAGARAIPEIKDIIAKITFDDEQNLFVFDEKILAYIDFHQPTAILKNISSLLYTVFFNNDLRELIEIKQTSVNNQNIYHALVLESLPKLNVNTKSRKDFGLYENFASEIVDIFREDLAFMIPHKSFFIDYFPILLKYYYFAYLKQLVLELDNFFGNSNQRIFLTVEWETLSQSRLSHQYGWSLLESKTQKLFSYANFLEMISYIEKDAEPFLKGNFHQIKEKIESLNQFEVKELADAIAALENHYREQMKTYLEKPFKDNGSWLHFDQEYYSNRTHPVYYQLHKLFSAIDYQFTHSERDSPYKRYRSWIIDFCRLNFVRNRGRLGPSLSLDQDTLLFITKLCLRDQPKIRLKQLWEEYKKRGLHFDDTTRDKIAKLFSKINLLEKKSDSGDAQYVKAIQ